MSNFDIPCENCVCVPICRNKEVKPMFNQCKLIMTFCRDFVDESSNRTVAVDMLNLGDMINEILNRHFMPYLSSADREKYSIGFIDIHPTHYNDKYLDVVHRTYRIFKSAFQINLLDNQRLNPYLYPLVYTLDKDE